jgi:LysR family transcriptional activator of nhaA
MVAPVFSYRPLYYFWVVAHEGGVARGAARLGVATQTVSAQLRALEAALGRALLRPAGRTLALTDAGRAALRQADQIFALGQALPAMVRAAGEAPALRLAVGVSDGLAKVVVHRLLQPVTAAPGLHLRCEEGDLERLLAELALHRLDVVLADRPAPPNPNLRLYSHPLGRGAVAWYGAPRLAAAAAQVGFPRALATLPVLLPTPQSALRPALDPWFERHDLRPQVAGEFADSALLKTFAAEGLGLFAGSASTEAALAARYGVQRVGPCDGVQEQYFAVGTERRVQHPLVQRLLEAGG